MADAMTKLKKTDFIPFIDKSKTINSGSWTPSWARSARSTIFALNPNPQVTTLDFISLDAPIDVVEKYQPELPQECALYEGDPAYDFVFGMFYGLPTGSEAIVPALICFGGSGAKAWQIPNAIIQLGELNAVEGKLTFTMKLGGNIDKGTFTISNGAPTFVSSTDTTTLIGAVAWNVTAPVKAAAPQSTFTAGTGYTGVITWAPTASSFAASTVYTATVVLTAASGYKFAAPFAATDVTGRPASGFTVVRNSDTQVTITAAYPATGA